VGARLLGIRGDKPGLLETSKIGKNKLDRCAASTIRKSRAAACPAFCVQGFKELLGRGVPPPTPRLAMFFQKTAAIFRGRRLKNSTVYLKPDELLRSRWKRLVFCLIKIGLPSFILLVANEQKLNQSNQHRLQLQL
jgi:hypothetical protein